MSTGEGIWSLSAHDVMGCLTLLIVPSVFAVLAKRYVFDLLDIKDRTKFSRLLLFRASRPIPTDAADFGAEVRALDVLDPEALEAFLDRWRGRVPGKVDKARVSLGAALLLGGVCGSFGRKVARSMFGGLGL